MTMRPPIIAIIGRPNVGKSTLLNAWARRRISIVEPTPGVTRDRVSTRITYLDHEFEAVDTGGIGIIDVQHLEEHVERQIRFALDEADVVVFLVDARDGMRPLDQHVADILRRRGGRVILAANKCETAALEADAAEFHALGLGEPIVISAQERIATREVLDRVLEVLPSESLVDADQPEPMKLAVVGKRNSGKSTLVNTIAGFERVIVSEVPGATRDSIDVHVVLDDQPLLLIDTAGLRRGKSVQGSVDFYSQARSERSIRRADVVLLLLDCREKISKVDKAAGRLISLAKKPVIIGVNKWDTAGDVSTERYARYIQRELRGLAFAPLAFMSALEGTNLRQTLRLSRTLFQQAGTRAPTAEVNRAVEEAVARRSPPARGAKKPRIFYSTQVGVHPPTFALFVNDPTHFSPSWKRYLENRFRQVFPFREVPLLINFRPRVRSASAIGQSEDREQNSVGAHAPKESPSGR